MSRLLTPTLDYVFKRLFAEDQEILLDLVNAMLNFPESRRIQALHVKNPTILPEHITEKYIVLDILAVDLTGKQYDIEMQAQKYRYYRERLLYYLCQMYAKQLDSGQEYEELKPVIGMHFLNYVQFPDEQDFHYCFQLRDGQHPVVRLTDHLSAYVFELPTFEKKIRTAQWGDTMYEWLHFFTHAPEEDEEMVRTQYTDPSVQKAFHVLEKLSADDETRYQAEARERALRDRVSELSAARKEGREEGALIGQIRLLQEIQGQRVSPQEDLLQLNAGELQAMLLELKANVKR